MEEVSSDGAIPRRATREPRGRGASFDSEAAPRESAIPGRAMRKSRARSRMRDILRGSAWWGPLP
eukprot:812602-Pyramimonas_sp.AAC.1